MADASADDHRFLADGIGIGRWLKSAHRSSTNAGDQRKNDDLASKMRTHHQRIQRSLQDTKQVLAKSKCDNQAQVNTALAKMQAALDAMSQDLCQDQRHHKRSTSVAFDALAFDTKMQ